MNCDRCRELASEALDGALSGSLLSGFRAHLDECRPCGAFLAELRESLTLLTELPEIVVDDGFDERVWASIQASRRTESPSWTRRLALALPGGVRVADLFAWRWTPAIAVGAVIVALALSIGPNENRTRVASGPADGSGESLPGFRQEPLGTANGLDAQEVSVTAPMPVPVEHYLRQVRQSVPVGTGSSLRRSDFVYPVRRLEVTRVRTGATTGRVTVHTVTADPRRSVIAF